VFLEVPQFADQAGGTRYRCTGFTGTGSAYSGPGTWLTFFIFEPSIVDFHWVTQHQLTTQVSPLGSGWVGRTPWGWGFDWYDEGTNVGLQAYSNVDHVFLNWDGNPAIPNPRQVVMNAPASVTANFDPVTPQAVVWLGVDGDHDGFIMPGDDDTRKHQRPGRLVRCNNDDDDENGTLDKNQYPLGYDDDLIGILAQVYTTTTPVVATIDVTTPSLRSNIRLWNNYTDTSTLPCTVEINDLWGNYFELEGLVPGEVILTLTVRDGENNIIEQDSAYLSIIDVDLDVDANRDGAVDNDNESELADDIGEDNWEYGTGLEKGATIHCNNDDDAPLPVWRQPDNEDHDLDGITDLNDLAPLVLRTLGSEALPTSWYIDLTIVNDDERIRIFDSNTISASAILGSGLGSTTLIADLISDNLNYTMEASYYPASTPAGWFDGIIGIELALKDANDEVFDSDIVQVRIAPWIMISSRQPATQLYVVALDSLPLDPRYWTTTFIASLHDATSDITGFTITEIDGDLYDNDPWIQDQIELGYSRAIGATNLRFDVVLDSPRLVRPDPWNPIHGLAHYPETHLLGPNFGYVTRGTSDIAVLSTYDSFGNLEVSPPVSFSRDEDGIEKNYDYPLGRIIYGFNSTTSEGMQEAIRNFLSAQEVQAPIEIDTTWLWVGHVDEVISFVPVPDTDDFRMLVASTRAASTLLSTINATSPNAYFFEGLLDSQNHDASKQVSTLYTDAALWAFNDQCQAYIDAMVNACTRELGLNVADIIEIPVMFEEHAGTGDAIAMTPDMVNIIVIDGGHVIVPEPHDPQIPGSPTCFEQDVVTKLEAIGITPIFVDDWYEYHIGLGEIHCGTNTRRIPITTFRWWEKRSGEQR
jgi:protein-arginine deiminase